MFAYCGNCPIIHEDSSGDLWWIPGTIGAGINFISTLLTGGDLGDACISAAEGFVLAYLPDEIKHVGAGIVTAVNAWANGSSFWGGLGSGAISFLVSFVSGDVLLSGANASDIEKYIIDLTFGFGAELVGDALSEGFFSSSNNAEQTTNQKPNPPSNGTYWSPRYYTQAINKSGGGGGRNVLTKICTVY